MFKHAFSIKGRITRSEFLASCAAFLVAEVFWIGLIKAGLEPVAMLLFMASLWMIVTQGWKRAQDAGWFGASALIPVFNPLGLLLMEGTRGPNAFGPDPRNPTAPEPEPTPTALPRIDAWERARKSEEPKIRTTSFKCVACGAQNANVEFQGTACCQFCGAPKE